MKIKKYHNVRTVSKRVKVDNLSAHTRPRTFLA